MRTRWVLALVVALAGAGGAAAQPAPADEPLPTGQPIPLVPAPAPPAQPGQAPPLLPVPDAQPPLAVVPRPGAPGVEYDPNYLYLPESAPDRRVADLCGPPGRWWVAPSLELAWAPTRAPQENIRLRLPDPSSPGTVAGPVVPVGGRSSGRFAAALGLAAGHWFDEANTRGVEASLFLRDASNTFGALAPGALVTFPRGDRGPPELVALPKSLAAGVVSTFPFTLDTFFATFDVNYRQRLYCDDGARLDWLAGYRYAFVGDELYLGDDTTADYRQNRAAVSNSFSGAQVGLAGEVRASGWYASGAAKIAFGATHSDVSASGIFSGAEGRFDGRYRRLPGLAWTDRTTFAVLPSLSVQVGRQISPHVRVFTGYSFTYLSRVARLGDALAPQNAGLSFTDFWVQSINFGADFRF
jgi:hypothetical protein